MDYLTFCESVLGPGVKTSMSEYEFECPNKCGLKLGVNIDKGIYKCFICGSPSTLSWRDRFALSRTGTFFGCGPIQLLAAYFNQEDVLSGKVGTQNLPPVRKAIVDKPLPLVKFRLFLTELFLDPQISDYHKQYLDSRGFSKDFWAKKGIVVDWGPNPLGAISSSIALEFIKKKYSTEEQIELKLLRDDGKYAVWLRDKVIIPYYNYTGNMVLGARGRTPLEVSKLKYFGPLGLQIGRLIYNLPDLQDTDTVLLGEGELKVKLASLFGVKGVALPGVTTAREAALEYFVRNGIMNVVVCFDTESLDNLLGDKLESKIQAKEAVKSTWIYLKEYGQSLGLNMIELELPDEGHKVDIDSYIIDHGPNQFFNLLEDKGVFFKRKWKNSK